VLPGRQATDLPAFLFCQRGIRAIIQVSFLGSFVVAQAPGNFRMNRPMRDFTDLLLSRGIVSLEQLAEAASMSKKEGKPIGDCLVELQYATPEEVTKALAEFHKCEYVDLTKQKIDDQVIQLVPESVARENKIIPFAEADDAIRVLVSDPLDIETIEKLRFILNRKVETALAPKEHIQEAINRYYGQTEGESADSMLQEFTDTQIDFTETEQDKIAQEEAADEDSAPVVRLVHDFRSRPASGLGYPCRAF
jgi:type IV pilus assembly protein PilB